MKITKTPKRKPEVPPAVAALCAHIAEVDQGALPDVLLGVTQWPWPRGDLYTWVGVLNRFDDLLARVCGAYELRPVQLRAFTAEDKQLVLGVLHFSRLLLENCLNRKLYASYEHLNTLLGTSDDAVLESTLRLVLRPAQQHSGTSNPRHELPISRQRLGVLAAVWPLREAGVELLDAARDAPVAAACTASMHYYKHASRAASAAAPAPPATPGATREEGLTRVEVSLEGAREPAERFAQVAERTEMSEDEQFELFQRIRLGIRCAAGPGARRTALVCRLLAIACFAHCVPESVANARLFVVEPNLVGRMVALLDPAHDEVYVQGAALYALDSVSHYRARLQEVLSALNASVSHGVLLEVLERMTERLPVRHHDAAMDLYVDGVMTLVAYLTTTVSGSSMVVGAGLIARLLDLARLPTDAFLVQRTTSRAVGLLDSVMYAYPPAFQQFLEARGLDLAVERIAGEVAYARAWAPSQAGGVAPDALYGALPFGRVTLLRNLLKMVLHLMTTPGTAEGLRTLIDSSLLTSLRGVMELRSVFGALVLAQSIHIMATFVHNEPTLLSTVQEQRLPEAFVDVSQDQLAPSFELISAMTTAVGALSLNAPGLALLTHHEVVPRLLSVLDSERHQKMLLDRDNANVFGSAIDELVRHHPSLRHVVLARIHAAIGHTLDAAEHYTPPDTDEEVNSHYRLLPVAASAPGQAAPVSPAPVVRVQDVALDESDTLLAEPNARDVNLPVNAFDIQCRFLEGLFRNTAHCRDFLAAGGLERLLRFYGAPCLVYNFAATTPADSFVTLLRVMTDVSPEAVIRALLGAMHTSLADPDALPEASPLLIPLLAPSIDTLSAANQRFRALVALNVRAHLLSDLAQTLAYAGQKLPLHFLQALHAGGTHVATLRALAATHRRLAYENLLVKAAAAELPRAPPKGTDLSALARNVTAVTYLGAQLPVSLYAFLGETVRMLVPRRNLDPAYRTAAAGAARELGEAFAAYLAPRDTCAENATAELTYLLHVLHGMLFDERASAVHVQTLVLTAFDAAGGMHQLLSRLDALRTPLAHDADRSPVSLAAHASDALRLGLELLLRMTQARALLESPHTAHLLLREPDREPFEPHAFLVRMRAESFAFLATLWAEPWLPTLPLGTVRALVQALLVVLKGDAESPPKKEPEHEAPNPLFSSALASLTGRGLPPRRSTPHADAGRIAQLTEMGFGRGAARRALERTHNNISAATEYILQHPELEEEPDTMETESHDAAPPADNDTHAPPAAPPAAAAPDAPSSLPFLSAMDSPLAPLLALPRREMPAAPPAAGATPPAPPSPAKRELDAQRAAFIPGMLTRTLQLAETHEPLVFDAKFVFLLLAEKEAVPPLWAQVVAPLDVRHAIGPGAHRIAVRLHFAVLLLNTSQVQSKLLVDDLATFLDRNVALVATAQEQPLPPHAEASADGPDGRPREAHTASDAPWPVPWLTSSLLSLCSVLALCERPAEVALHMPPTPLLPPKQAEVLSEARTRTVPLALWALQAHAALPHDALLAVYRLLALLTRTASAAAALGAQLPALFAPLATKRGAGCHRFAVMAVRHIIEYAGVLPGVMDREIHAWVTNHVRARSSESSSFSKGMAYAVLRDLYVFMDAAERQVEVLDFHGGKGQAFLRLHPQAPAGHEQNGEATSDAVVSFLLETLLVAEDEAYRFFLLQMLTELLSSYMVCKQSFLRFRHEEKSRAALFPFLTQLVPAGFLKSYNTAELRKRMAESNWAMSVLVALAAEPCASSDATSVAEPLIVVRKTLLDALQRALREAAASPEPVELRYGRLYALSDLCYRLLTAQPNPPSTSGTPPKLHTEVALHMAKTMLEKNYVTVLTSALADVDLNMPTVKALLEGMLRPLEHLTKVAMKMGKSASARAQHAASDTSESSSESMHAGSESSADEDAPDFYRNSSLGMHTGEMEHGLEEEQLSDEMDEEDIEMDEYDSQNSSLSTDEEGLDGDSAHVVEVMDEDEDDAEDEEEEDDEEEDDVDDDEDVSIDQDDEDALDDEGVNDTGSSAFASEEYEVEDDGVLPEHDYDYLVDDEAPEEAGEDVGHILEALDGMGQQDEDAELGEDESGEEDLYDHGALSRLEITDDAWPMHAQDDRFGANWNWMSTRRGRAPELPPTFFPRPNEAAEAPRPPPAGPARDEEPEGEHPLLVDDRLHEEPRGLPLPDWQRNVEALVGGGTMQVLEMLLNRGTPPGPDASIRIELAENGRGPPRMHITNLGRDAPSGRGVPPAGTHTGAGSAADGASGTPDDDVVAQAHRFTPLATSARWAEEARLIHGSFVAEHALCIRNHLINLLLPAYEQRKSEEAQAKRQQEQEKRLREEELYRAQQEKEETQRQLNDSKRKLQELEERDAPEASTAPQPRVTVSVHGETVDLTDTGIDPTFLEALPDELREEALLSQQLSRRREEPVSLAPDFLEALPAPVRSELEAHSAPSAAAQPSSSHAPPAEPAEPPQPSGEQEPRREAPPPPRDAIQLLDRAGIATLVRLLYFPQIQTRSSSLYKVLVHLAENSKTRGDLLHLLLTVLAEGTASIHAVDKSFAHMSSRAARTATPQRSTPRRAPPASQPATPQAERAVAPLSHIGDEAPHLIAARTIETLMHLVQANEHASAYFLCEEVRGKKRSREARSPIHVLLGLLEKDAILGNAQLVDALIALLNVITKPLTSAQPPPPSSGAMAVLRAPLAGTEVPPIASERLAAVVRPLRTAISSRGFQHTLAVAAHLAHLRGARDVISAALQHEVQRASAALVGDLDALIVSLPPPDDAETAPERIHSAPLAKLASPTSAQAQFLRCLRALDYLYMGK